VAGGAPKSWRCPHCGTQRIAASRLQVGGPGYRFAGSRRLLQPQGPWTPKEPVDVRDIIQVPPGLLAPRGYVEYFPGWWAPGSELTNTPTIPKPR